MKKTYEYFVTVKNDRGEFSLECICGRNEEHARNVFNELVKKHPEKEYKFEKEECEECWWEVYGTH